jgi:hypothetical protein
VIDLESELRLVEDAVDVAAFLADNGGTVTPGWTRPAADPDPADEPGVYWLTLRPRSAPTEQYYARVAWSRYPGAPPSVKYATGVRGRLDVTSAWPNVAGYRPGNADICADFTKEGYEAHPEWVAQRPWQTTGNPFLWVAQILQGHLDRSYSGRAT